MSAATDNLRDNQEQADRDGIMVKVSRQAVDETLAEYSAMLATLESMRAFVGIMFGEGPDATMPEIVKAPIGVPIMVGDLVRSADAVLAKANSH